MFSQLNDAGCQSKIAKLCSKHTIDSIHLQIDVLYLLKGIGGKVKQLIEVGRFCCI